MKLSGVLSSSIILCCWLACSGDSSSGGGPSGGAPGTGGDPPTGPGGAGSGTGGTAGGGAAPAGCEPACVRPQFCSAAGQCIDEGTCLADDDCPVPGTICDLVTSACVPGGGCEDLSAMIEPIPPNLLLVLDRSCSMTDTLAGGETKWEAAVAAINTFTTTYAGDIRFGLSLFPDLVQPGCGQADVVIPVAPGTEAAIQTLMTASLVNADPYFPDGPCVTNIDSAMEQAAAAPELMDPDRDNYVALVTDGKQSACNLAGGDAGTTQIITDLAAAGVPTFVVGFGSGIDPAQMDLFALAGGVPNVGPAYYDASDQASLEAALQVIAEKAISCTFTLDTVPPNPDQIYVFFDGVAVPLDATMMNGFSYDPSTNQIVFHGAACDTLKSGTVTSVDVILGCRAPQ